MIMKLKTVLFALCSFAGFLSCKAQQIYPYNTNPLDVPNGAYIKDLNNELNKYIGVWKGNWDGKTLYLDLRKHKVDRSYYSIDKIIGERKIINSQGQVEFDRISNFNYSNPEIEGPFLSVRYRLSGKEAFSFYPENMCGKGVILHIIEFTGNTMTLKFEYEPSHYKADCIHNSYIQQYDDFPINFPRNTITLTKQ